MSKTELTKLVEDELRPYGIDGFNFKKGTGDINYLVLRVDNKEHDVYAPRSASNKHEVAIFRTKLHKKLRDLGIFRLDPEVNRVHANDRIAECERRDSVHEDRLAAMEEMLLEGLAKLEPFMNVAPLLEPFMRAVSGGAVSGPKVAPAPASPPEPQKNEPIPFPTIKPTPRPVERPEEPKKVAAKGLDALEELRLNTRAEALAEVARDFEIDDFEGHILHFIHKCGPQTAHDLRWEQGGPWKSADRVTDLLDEMESKRLLRRVIVDGRVERKYALTNKGIEELAGESIDEVEAVAPVPLASTEAMLNPPRPALTVVPTERSPRVLAPSVASLPTPLDLNVMDALIVYLYKNPGKTTVELRLTQGETGLKGYGVENDLTILTSRAATLGFAANSGRGKPWFLTPLGREKAEGLLRGQIHSEVRRQFVK